MPEITLEQGTIHYEDHGDGPPVVMLHGYLMDGRLWDPVSTRLADRGLRAIAPHLPFGAHRTALKADADLTPTGIAAIVAAFVEALGLQDVTLVGNDSGGAMAQITVTEHPERIGRLVLTNCDAFENFPPKLFKPLVQLAKVPGALTQNFRALKLRPARRLPMAYGSLMHGELPDDLIDSWVDAYFADKGVRRDVRKVTQGLLPSYTLDAAAKLPGFDRPALIIWATDDAFFPMEHARRLAALLPDSRLETIERSRTWVMLDQPERTAQLIADFARSADAPAVATAAARE